MLAERPREGTCRLTSDRRKFRFGERLREVASQEGERLVDAGRHVARGIGQIVGACQRLIVLASAEMAEDKQEELYAAYALGVHQLLHQRRDLAAGRFRKQHTTTRPFEQRLECGEFGQGSLRAIDELLGELDNPAA